MSSDEEKKVTDGERPALTKEDELAMAIHRGGQELTSGRAREASDLLEEAVLLARQMGDDLAEAEASGLLAQAYLRLDLRDEAARCASDAYEIAQARDDQAAMEHFQQLLKVAESSVEELEMATAFGDGRAALQGNDFTRASERLGRALELAEELDQQVIAGAALQLLAQSEHAQDHGDEARRLAGRAVEVAEAVEDQDAVDRARQLLSQLDEDDAPAVVGVANELKWGQEALADGDFERGVRHLERAREQAIDEGEVVPEASACGMLAQVYLELDRREEAAERARRALEIAESLDHEAAADFRSLLAAAESSPEAHELAKSLQLGAMALETGQLEMADQKLQRAGELAKGEQNEVAEALAIGMLARVKLQLDRREEAAELARRALEISRRRGEEAAITHFQSLLDEIEGGGGVVA